MTILPRKNPFAFRTTHTSASAYVPPTRTRAASEASAVVDRMQDDAEKAHQVSAYLGAAILDTLSLLRAAYVEAAEPNWDGYGAQPADPLAYHHARRFATLLYREQQPTDISIDPDGEISFDWDHGIDYVVSVSVSREGRLAYAARVGPNRSRGIERLSDGVPEQILALIRRVTSRAG